jgi:holo-[acyl-carrier protein] synthase
MELLGHGIDIVEIARMEALLSDHAAHFLARCFSAREVAEVGEAPYAAQRYAGRFALKEAVVKALGTGFAQGVSWEDVEVLHEPSGRPRVVLHGEADRMARALGVRAWLVSVSYADRYAVGSAIATG